MIENLCLLCLRGQWPPENNGVWSCILVHALTPVTTYKAALNSSSLRLLSRDPRGWWCFQRAHLPVHASLPLLQACWLVSGPPFSTKREPLTPTGHTPLLCGLAEDCNSIGCSFPSRGAFISQPELGYFGVLRLGCECKACACASSVTGLPVPSVWDFTCGPVLGGCVLFAGCWQLYSVFPVVLLSVWFAFLPQQFVSAPWVFFPSIFEITHMLMILCH